MSVLRALVAGVGTLLGAYGAALAVTRQEPAQLLELAAWLAAGVLLHDALVAAVVLVAAFLGGRLLPVAWHAPAALALLVWGSVSLMALPVLGRFGARADNPTLLDRPYLLAWGAATALTVLVVGVAGQVRSRRGENA